MLSIASLFLMLSMQGPVTDTLAGERAKITIINAVPLQRIPRTEIDGGPSTGDMLNNHFFPGVKYFNEGMYSLANEEFNYTLDRQTYLQDNPRQAEYLSTAYYLRGMIYLYHADGLGRHSFAKSDFENAIKWNANNHVAYLELSRVYSGLGLKDAAIAVLREMKNIGLEERLALEVEADLKKMTATAASTPAPSNPAASPAAAATKPSDKPATLPTGKIAVNSVVWADVYLAGKQVGSTPLTLELPQGEYTFEFRHDDLKQSVTLSAKANETITATVSFDVVLDINAKPWAEVRVEGATASLGHTPLLGVRVSPGTALLFRHPDFPEKRHKVESTDRAIGIDFP